MPLLGVIGGMGPLATADFFSKLVAATPAQRDEEHVPVLLHSVPQIPSRPAAILRDGESPLPALLGARECLLAAGATALAMPCNTAHHWYVELSDGCPVPFLHIADAVAAELPTDAAGTVGMLATRATLHARIFEERLAKRAITFVAPSDADYDALLQPAIDDVKRGELQQAAARIERLIDALRARGAQRIVLACTELPPALDAIDSPLRSHCIDATAALARACARWWLAQRPPLL